jgi:hypothetical protein
MAELASGCCPQTGGWVGVGGTEEPELVLDLLFPHLYKQKATVHTPSRGRLGRHSEVMLQ